ncbi:S8 family peptidase [Saccharothrix algeriensis]|uniref:S8 family serine peptidase n=1 Tax=Saccharothrix algeriensis TaxID=173560 RepID=A0A8T8HVN0_9PSEU|nr:S8 family serine peptidase [Saccharothrix algeriensis]MBM7814254.1 subtilisin family serine protease [Saccharothrix algeriensis]QTR02608.1 S8 family serine peptidase [Saccharothrix algeriensis]
MRPRTLPGRMLGLGLAATAATAAAVVWPSAATAAQEGPIVAESAPNAVQDSYIVVLKDDRLAGAAVRPKADDLLARYGGGRIGFTYRSALKGFSVAMPARQAKRLAADPAVAYVEQDRTVGLLTDQDNPPSWGLDRIDQDSLPLNQKYSYSTGASNVTAYVIDTGINYDHTDFGGRASFGFDAFSDGRNGKDCQGHGTHVSGTVGGRTFGVAKQVKLKAVRVLNCQGSGSVATEAAGVDWVTGNAVLPAVANMSLYTGTANEPSRVLDNAVKASIAKGISYVVAAGNFNDDSCKYSPQRVTETINVAASARTDARASFSSYGRCSDLFAPGQDIVSASYSNNSGSASMSGTSMASPHVAGAVALYLADNPAKTPAQVHEAILAEATPNKVTNPGSGTPNRLLRVNEGGAGAVTVANPGNQTTTVGGAANLRLTASGGTAPYTWSATGLPPGLSIGSSTGLVTGTATTAGSYTVTATATASAGGSGSTTFTWVVGAGDCAPQTNGADVAIPDVSTVTSSVTFSGCAGNASATSGVEVHIKHTYRGDLVIDLVAPDGTTYRLKNSSGGDSADNVDATYPVDLSSEARNGVWKLSVRDVAANDVGTIDSWGLTL